MLLSGVKRCNELGLRGTSFSCTRVSSPLFVFFEHLICKLMSIYIGFYRTCFSIWILHVKKSSFSFCFLRIIGQQFWRSHFLLTWNVRVQVNDSHLFLRTLSLCRFLLLWLWSFALITNHNVVFLHMMRVLSLFVSLIKLLFKSRCEKVGC